MMLIEIGDRVKLLVTGYSILLSSQYLVNMLMYFSRAILVPVIRDATSLRIRAFAALSAAMSASRRFPVVRASAESCCTHGSRQVSRGNLATKHDERRTAGASSWLSKCVW